MSTEERFLHKSAPGRSIGFFDVRRLGRYAWHETANGHLYEYDEGAFWHTPMNEGEEKRRQVDDESRLPFGPWCHAPACDCEECVPDDHLRT